MNIQHLRQSVKVKWLSYYEQNRSWLVKMRVWGTYNGLRRPSSGFILATLSILEPQFDQIISFILDLNNNPDQIVTSLGLNFNPDQELCLINSEYSTTTTQSEGESLEENSTESQPVPLVTVAPKISLDEAITSDQPPLDKPVSASTEHPEIIPTHKVVSSVAVATKVASLPSAQMVNCAKSPSSLLLEDKPVRLPPALRSAQSPLAITIDVLNKTKTLPSRKRRNSRFDPVPINFWTLLVQKNCLTGIFFLLDCLKSSVKNNSNHGKIPPKPKDIPRKANTNASSLASWVDECCQGREFDREAAISIRL
ncbi:DUF5331 domain-containing protein [Nodularia sphaerocarpa]|uniref:DUF5331 domain-containing protein n=1 Tax=Nodularia sphaerocarpa TaxID=137816 RepID=UPI001EFA58B5|nr:DUF5331 domain-containing protein [Nodularia sphaerocarpa]MDB9374947.1 DUF5331 domain-containing protein [Nodularia sphaerocarpa CS-585]MDB9379089.1 DUF5331 domain-containing protein [Nodularia sphaerocarpa CS-585A2]ULP72701.1 hypothetical protein BDGGKGIB_02346 [Nodularia sphaerocarpa UHCC 0038]